MFGALAPDAWIDTLVGHWRGRQEWILARQIDIAGIAAPTGAEARRAAHVDAQLRAIPAAHVQSDRHGNVCAVFAPASVVAGVAPIVCLAHLDTVFDADTPLVVHREGSIVRCPGIGDNSRGLAVLIAIAQALNDAEVQRRLTRPVHLVATVGEEGAGDLRGARGWFDDRDAAAESPPFAAIAIDGPGDDTVVHRAPGSIRLRVTITGPGGHSWTDANTANPVSAVGHIIAGISRLAQERPAGTTIAATRVFGGESLTAIPTACWVDIDMRGILQADIDRLRGATLALAARAAQDETTRHPHTALDLQVTALGERPAGSISEHHPLVRAAVVATAAAGRDARPAIASTDANIPLSRGIPAIALGAGGTGGGAHTKDEWFDDRHSHRGVERLLRLVLKLATSERSVDDLER
jgi:acetylornithine deacetylase/succinyl-diaminopimelate desuccinylase-like protein